MSENVRNPWSLTAATILLAAAIFSLDLLVPLGVAAGVPYVALVVLSLWSPSRRFVYGSAVLASVLTILGFLLSSPGSEPGIVLANRALALSAIWVTALLVIPRVRQWRLILDSMDDAVLVVDGSGRIDWVNRAATDLFSNVKPPLVGKSCYEVLHDSSSPPEDCPHCESRLCGVSSAGETFEHDRGQWLRISSYPVSDKTGTPPGCIIVVKDVTDLQLAEAATRERESSIREVLDSSPGVVFVKDLEGRFLFVNRRWEELFGRGRDSVIGLTDHDVFPKETADRFRQNDLDVLQRKTPVDFEESVLLDGEEHTYLLKKFLLHNEAGEPKAVCGIATDITSRKAVEERLRLASQVTEDMEEGILLVRASDRRIVYTNPRFERIFGYQPDELVGEHVTILNYHGQKTREETAAEIIKHVNENGRWNNEIHNVKKDGTPFWTRATVSAFQHAEHGTVYLTVQEDIDDRKKAEEELKESESRLRAVLDTVVDSIVSIDGHGTILSLNPSATAMFGWTADEIVGQNIKVLMPEPYRSEHDEYLARYRETGEKHIIGTIREVSGRRKDGSTFPAELSVSEVRPGDGGVFTGMIRDITERKETEEAARLSKFAVDHASYPIYRVSADGRIAYANAHASTSLGYSIEELMTMRVSDFAPDLPREAWPEHWREMKEAGALTFESHHRNKEGRIFAVEITTNYLRQEGDEYVWAYVRDISERKIAKRLLEEEVQWEKLVSDVSTQFIVSRSRDVGRILDATLEIVGTFLGADRCSFNEFSEDETEFRTTHIWVAEGLKAENDIFSRNLSAEHPWYTARLRSGLPVVFSQASPFPQEAANEQRLCFRLGILSSVNVPISIGGSNLGALGVDAIRTSRDWGQETVDRLRVIGEIIGSALSRTRVIDELLSSEERFRSLVAASSSVVWIADASGAFATQQDSWAAYTGQSWPEHQGTKWVDMIHPGDRDRLLQVSSSIISNARAAEAPGRIWNEKSGIYHHCVLRAVPILSDDGLVVEWVGAAEDVHERRTAEEKVEASERELRLVIDNIPGAVSYVGTDERYRLVNRRYEQWFGLAPSKVVGQLIADIVGLAAHRVLKPHIKAVLEGEAVHFEAAMPFKHGGLKWVSTSFIPHLSSDDEVQGFFVLATDVTEQRLLGGALRNVAEGVSGEIGEAFFRSLAEHLAQSLGVRYAFVCEVKEGEPLTGVTIAAFVDGKIIENFVYRLEGTPRERVLQDGAFNCPDDVRKGFPNDPYLSQVNAESFAGVRLTSSSGEVCGMISVMDDRPMRGIETIRHLLQIYATRAAAELERRRAEKRERQQQAEFARVARLNTMGEMASALAHELNQPLSALMNRAEASLVRLESDLPDYKKVQENVAVIVREAERAGSIIRHVRDFVRPVGPHRKPADLNHLIRGAVALVEHEARLREVDLKLELSDSLPLLSVDEVQLEQVVLNLLTNGIEALDQERGEKQVIIATGSRPSGEVEVTVKDNGPGISPKTIDRVFDSFFTTKTDGMGMGLAISRSIVEAHGGRLDADESDERGASFRFTLPIEP